MPFWQLVCSMYILIVLNILLQSCGGLCHLHRRCYFKFLIECFRDRPAKEGIGGAWQPSNHFKTTPSTFPGSLNYYPQLLLRYHRSTFWINETHIVPYDLVKGAPQYSPKLHLNTLGLIRCTQNQNYLLFSMINLHVNNWQIA